MRSTFRWMTGAALLATAACQDLATVPSAVPTELRIDRSIVTTTEGSDVEFTVTVLDQNGDPMEIPAWAQPEWSVASPAVLQPTPSGVHATAPGSSTATARVAGLESAVTVRVNPASLKLVVAEVRVWQAGNSRPHLLPDQAAQVAVFLTGDKVNFFSPAVVVKVIRHGEVVHEASVRRGDESVPQSHDADDLSSAWLTQIPGAHLQPGVSIVVEADPVGEITRAEGSVDRFPASGAFALDVQSAQLQLRVVGAHLTQSVQTFDGRVPLVAGRDALLRVFVTGDEATELTTSVRASLYAGATPVHQVTIERGAPIPTWTDETTLAGSWNVRIPVHALAPGVSLVLEADPEGKIGLRKGSEPRLPSSGTLALDIREVPTFWARMVPIHQSAYGTTGTVNAGNIESFLDAVTAKFAIAGVNADLRAAYVTNAQANTTTGWSQILSAMWALRTAEGSGRYYYGVLRLPAGSPYGGLGYVGWPAAVGHDQGSQAYETFAHEIGHNFSLWHAPCGNPSNVDAAFPYSNGSIGVFGYDLLTGQLKHPSLVKDLMTYCRPEWISDYSYAKAMEYRDRYDWARTGPDRMAAREASLLVWGRVDAGRLVLEPSFELTMSPQLPQGTGAYRIEGRDAAGNALFDYRFDPIPFDHATGSNFAFSIPSRIAQTDRLATLRLIGPEGEVVRQAAAAGEPVVTAEARAPGVALSWASGYEMALVRDAATGEIISFARGDFAAIPDRPVEVILSDGVRSYPARMGSR
ncbi:MAG TPA: M66 family metalloprotease [Longimicrobiaceae bacterium]|nr:M66 family metalloprotease [Longimicrobiaceae bacterium]